MRTFESSLITDFFKDQNWRCRAAIVTLRNRMDDDWVDLWLLDCFVKEDFKQKHSEKKYGWIDTFLMSIILQVITKYLIQWLLDNFTIQDSNKTKDADCHITPQSEWKGKDIWSTAGDDGIVDV